MRQAPARGFFSRIGCGAAVLLMTTVAVITWYSGGILFSPGPLTASAPQGVKLGGFSSHADFEHQCSQCHAAWLGVTARRCENCHTDIWEQERSGLGLHARLNNVQQCESCHTEHIGRQANISTKAHESFDHESLTDFSLAKHRRTYQESSMTCDDCHSGLRFTIEAIDCISCHSEHDGVFMDDHVSLFGAECLLCHDGLDTMARFQHDSVFVLDGAHAAAACESCHQDQGFIDTANECVACHSEPEVHAGLFGLDCGRCHTATAWTPAHLMHHTFDLEHGEGGENDCSVCHTSTYVNYTCYTCHEHKPTQMREVHEKENIFEFDDCVACHPTGAEGEGRRMQDERKFPHDA